MRHRYKHTAAMVVRVILVLVLSVCSSTPALSAASSEQRPCTVTFSERGRGSGVFKRTFNGLPYCEFLGIRYAEAPTAGLRFENPVLRHPEGELEFKELGSICPQVDDFNHATQVLGDEDCLFIDIYHPVRSSPNDVRKLPVLVFVHGGSFAVGSSTSDLFGVDLLMEHDIIVVSVQYRLDPLGFLRSSHFNISGNFGLKDQRAALRWVQLYINRFGGDPTRVTLMGHSAGAASVTYHLYSNSSKGLFHQAFALGGSMLAPWAFLYDADNYSYQYFRDLNITTIEELKNVDFKTFWNKDIVYKFATVHYAFCVPSAEADEPDAFFTKSPPDLIREKPINAVPLLFGQSSEEFELFLSYVHDYWMGENYPNIQNETLKHYIEDVVDRAAELAESINVELSKDVFYQELSNTANWFFPNKLLLNEYSRWVRDATYFFRFQYDGKFGRFKREFQEALVGVKHYGAIHGDELGYIFTPNNVEDALANRSLYEEEWMVHERTVQLVASFVKFGTPNKNQMELVWQPYKSFSSSPRYLNIDKTFEIRTEQRSLYHAFWSIIYQCLYHYSCSEIDDLPRLVERYSRGNL
ncbi:esterase B1-like [Topomyia yanbarensis]|uniref:esterase B1-like n=1 Tax=Topomyia yanbarensis TaxID=2498891 RepID=UPI00273AD464|nr:esterase B1-like [Topomyia yanbarensis]